MSSLHKFLSFASQISNIMKHFTICSRIWESEVLRRWVLSHLAIEDSSIALVINIEALGRRVSQIQSNDWHCSINFSPELIELVPSHLLEKMQFLDFCKFNRNFIQRFYHEIQRTIAHSIPWRQFVSSYLVFTGEDFERQTSKHNFENLV
jgi:hypothetical protein